MNFSTATAEQLNAHGMTVKKLRTRGPRKGETISRASAGMVKGGAKGSIQTGDSSTHAFTAGGGKEQTFTKACGIGKEMVRDLDAVKRKAAAQYKADRRQAAIDRAMGL